MRWLWQEVSAPGTPWDNMARDEAAFYTLRESPDALPTVRIYYWDRPSVSIGRLQDEAAVRRVFGDLPLVRRPTGGRAVVHGEDLTISVICRNGDLPPCVSPGVLSSYRQIVAGLVSAFAELGVAADFGSPGSRSGSVDCFADAARCDLIDTATARKLAGSAQRRESGVILQQMSIPIQGVVERQEFLQAAQDGFMQALGVSEWLSVDMAYPV